MQSEFGPLGRWVVPALLLSALLGGCSWWRKEAVPPAAAADVVEPVDRTASTSTANSAAKADPMLQMERNADGEFIVSLSAESGLPLLKAGASRAEFDAQIAKLGAKIVSDSSTRVEVEPGGEFSDRGLPMRVFYEFDAAGKFVRTVGEF